MVEWWVHCGLPALTMGALWISIRTKSLFHLKDVLLVTLLITLMYQMAIDLLVNINDCFDNLFCSILGINLFHIEEGKIYMVFPTH